MKYIAICGTVGAGKTTLLNRLCEQLSHRCKSHEERPQDNPFIQEYYANSKNWSFHSQACFLALYYHPADWLVRDKEFYFFDRCLIENLQIARYRLQVGDLSQHEFDVLEMLAKGMEMTMPQIDKYIYLRCSDELLLQHLHSRGRDYESTLDCNYVSALKCIYDHWAETLPQDRTFVYDCDNPPPLQNVLAFIGA